MTPDSLPVALGVCRLATRLPEPERVHAAAVVLAAIGIIPYGDLFEPLPTACGHPSSRLYRPVDGSRGIRCRTCDAHTRKGRA